MKKSLIVFVLFVVGLLSVVSCSLEDDPKVNFHLAYLPADSVSVPESIRRGQIYPISMYYKKPDNCHYFNGFYYNISTNVRTVAIEAMVLDNVECAPTTTVAADVATFNFQVPIEQYGYYRFKFYSGVDENGEDLFTEIEIPVVE